MESSKWDYISSMNTRHMAPLVNCFMLKSTCQKQASSGIDYETYYDKVLLLAGSIFDGLFIPVFSNRNKKIHITNTFTPTDTDIMVSAKWVIGDIPLMHTEEDTHGGFTRLKITDENPEARIPAHLGNYHDQRYLSTSKLVNVVKNEALSGASLELQKRDATLVMHGPSIAIHLGNEDNLLVDEQTLHSLDLVSALPCPQWPPGAWGWLLRPRKWPSTKLCLGIFDAGCYMVPVAHAKSLNKDTEWRFSFSLAEKILTKTFNPTQRQCYIILKTILWHKQIRGVSSYHLKTTFFWVCERVPQQYWRADTILARINDVLDTLIHFLARYNLPNFFFEANNMIDHLDRSIILHGVKQILKIRKNPIEAILLINDVYIFNYHPLVSIRELFKPMISTMHQLEVKKSQQHQQLMETAHNLIVELFKEFILYNPTKGNSEFVLDAIMGPSQAQSLVQNPHGIHSILTKARITTQDRISYMEDILDKRDIYSARYHGQIDVLGKLVYLRWIEILELCQQQSSLPSAADVLYTRRKFQKAMLISPQNDIIKLYFATFLIACEEYESVVNLLYPDYRRHAGTEPDQRMFLLCSITTLDKVFFDGVLQAWVDYEKCILVTNNQLIYYLLVVALGRMGEIDGALAMIPQMLAIGDLQAEPMFWQYHLLAGLACLQLERKDFARGIFEKVTQLYPKFKYVRHLLTTF